MRYVKKNEDPRDYRVDFSKIKRVLGFNVSITLPEGIKEIKEALDRNIFPDLENAIYRNS